MRPRSWQKLDASVGALADSVAELEVANLVTVGRLIAQAALLRTESRGCHFRSDYPEREEAWRVRIVQQRAEQPSHAPVVGHMMLWTAADAVVARCHLGTARHRLGSSGLVFVFPDSSHIIALALAEDLGVAPERFGPSAPGTPELLARDVTSFSSVGLDAQFSGVVVARHPCTVAGLPLLAEVYDRLSAAAGLVDPVEVFPLVAEGARVEAGTCVAEVGGIAAAVLAGERTALNFLMELSGIATQTARWVKAAGDAFAVCDTRKTPPGLRALAKYAVGVGGGTNHRSGLHDMVLVKDNHIRRAGGITAAVDKARAARPDLLIEVEADSLVQAIEAVGAGADMVLLDNFDDADLAAAVKARAQRRRRRQGVRFLLRRRAASRSIGFRRSRRSGVDRVSSSALTFGAPVVDFGLDETLGRGGAAMSLLQSILDWALSALGTWGYLIVFLATMLENLFIVGSFTPGDVLTAAAAFTAATQQGTASTRSRSSRSRPWARSSAPTSATSSAGAGVATSSSASVRASASRSRRSRRARSTSTATGRQTIIIARFVAVMKNLAPALAGAAHMNVFWFEVYTLVGSMGYAGILVGIGWFLGANFEQGLAYLGAFSWLVFARSWSAASCFWSTSADTTAG